MPIEWPTLGLSRGPLRFDFEHNLPAGSPCCRQLVLRCPRRPVLPFALSPSARPCYRPSAVLHRLFPSARLLGSACIGAIPAAMAAKPRAAVAGVLMLPTPAAFLAPPSVLARPGSHRPWSHSTRLPSPAAARGLRLAPARSSHAARLLPIMAEGGGEPPPAASPPSASADVPAAAGGVSQLTGPARARQEEKVRKALSEAERLKQLAAEARYVQSRVGSARCNFLFAGGGGEGRRGWGADRVARVI